MTDFMTAPPVIHIQPTVSRDQSEKGVQIQLTCNLSRESPKTQVWLCFLVLSFMSTSTFAASDTVHLQNCLDALRLKNNIERSDAMLYAPSANDVEEKCNLMSLRCYILELMMVITEEEIFDHKANCIFDFNDNLPTATPVGCPPCEAYSLKNITVFLGRLNNLLQKMNSHKT